MTTETSSAEAVQERAATTASTAADQGRHVADVTKEQAASVASEARSQARHVVSDAVSQVKDTAKDETSTQRDRLVGTLSTVSDDLTAMADQRGSGLASDMVREIAQRARALASRLEGREPEELLEDVRRFARQRPGTFLLGALAAGVVAGRLLRGTGDAVAAASAEPAESDWTRTTTAPPAMTSPTMTSPTSTSMPGQPTQDPTPTSTLSGNESGYSGGGLSEGGRA